MNDIATRPDMQAAIRHKRALAPFVDDKGNVEASEVHAKTELIPKEDARAAVFEITAALEPTDDASALVFANMLIAQCTIKEVVDPKGYIRTLAGKFTKFPSDIGERIVDEVTDKLKYNPKGADVMEVGERMVKERKAALYTANRHLEERERRRKYFEDKDRLDAERKTREADLEAKYKEAGLDWPGYEKASWTVVIAVLGAVETE